MKELKNSVIGIAGCGAMGLPMAKSLIKSGFDTIGFDILPAAHFGGFSDKIVGDPLKFSHQCDIAI